VSSSPQPQPGGLDDKDEGAAGSKNPTVDKKVDGKFGKFNDILC
jgi:hypothetical protein